MFLKDYITGENIYYQNKNQILINGSRGALTLLLKFGYNFSDLNFLYKIYVYMYILYIYA